MNLHLFKNNKLIYKDIQIYIIIIMQFTLLISCQDPENKSSLAKSNNFNYLELDITEIQQGYIDGTFTIKEIVQAYLDRIEEIDKSGPALGAIIQVNPDAIKIAKQLDNEIKEGKLRGSLHGIVVVLKDNIDTFDNMATTGGSRALKNSFPLKDSYLARQLKNAGAIIIGKANLSELANFRGELATSGWSGIGGQTKNPYVLTRNPCGSSSGSAVAVSANLTMLAIGTETNGSIVCPSHSNGIVGIKPTVGLISRSGIIPISYTHDTPGPMARNVKDAAILLGALVGIDSADEKTFESKGKYYSDYTKFLNKDGLKGKRIGLYQSPLGINFKVDTLMSKAVGFLKSHGVEIVDIDNILSDEAGSNSFQVMLYEFKDGLNAYLNSLGKNAPVKNIEELIAFNEKDSIELIFFNQKHLKLANKKKDLNSEEYIVALEKLKIFSRDEGIDRIMKLHNLDAIIAPTGGPAWKTDLINGDSFQLGSSSPAALAGYPNITVPMGFIEELPIGISFFGKAWSEPILLEIAYAYENGTKHRQSPKFLISD